MRWGTGVARWTREDMERLIAEMREAADELPTDDLTPTDAFEVLTVLRNVTRRRRADRNSRLRLV